MANTIVEKAPFLAGLTSQLEDYLETISALQIEDRVARAKDIAERLGVTRGTVTSALKSLSQKGLINYQPYSHITLTTLGEMAAGRIAYRHKVVARYLSEVLQLPPEVAEENACRAEHVLDIKVIERLACFLDFLDKCPRLDGHWQESLKEFCENGEESRDCRECVGQCLAGLFNE